MWERDRERGYRTGNNPITEAAKDLRQKQTEAEKKLWLKLRAKRFCKAKFRRQEPIGNFIVDFVSYNNNLVIEVDGSPHKETEVKTNDRQRALWLQSEGFKLLRFWNGDILKNMNAVLDKIKSNIEQ